VVGPGKCSICGNDRIEIKPNHWACPIFYGSPMHRCDAVTFAMEHHYSRRGAEYFSQLSEEDFQAGEEEAGKRLMDYCGCTVEEYLTALERRNWG